MQKLKLKDLFPTKEDWIKAIKRDLKIIFTFGVGLFILFLILQVKG